MKTLLARARAVLTRLRDAEPAQLIQYAGTLFVAAAAFGVAVPVGLDVKVAAGITVAAGIRDLFVSRATRAAVWSPASVDRLAAAAKALGAPPDKVDAVVQLVQSGQLEALQELLVATDEPGQHAADRTA